MVRRASEGDVLEEAKACLLKARTLDELRQAQAVVLPLELGLSLEKTAQVLGVSVGWACQLRRRFVRTGGICEGGRGRKGGRHHENMTIEEERIFLLPFFEKARVGGILVDGEIKKYLYAQAIDVWKDQGVELSIADRDCHIRSRRSLSDSALAW